MICTRSSTPFTGQSRSRPPLSHCLLPPQQAAWIPAGVEHRTTIRSSVRTISVFFDSATWCPHPANESGSWPVPPVLREMMIYSGRWPIGRPSSDEVADTYFAALGRLVSELLDDEQPLSLPTSTDPVLAGAMAWTRENLDTATVAAVARAMSGCRNVHCAAVSKRALACRGGATWSRHVCCAPWLFSPNHVRRFCRLRRPLDSRARAPSTARSANGRARPPRATAPSALSDER